VTLVGFEDALKAAERAPRHRKHTRPPKSGLVSRIGNQSYIFRKTPIIIVLNGPRSASAIEALPKGLKSNQRPLHYVISSLKIA